MSHNKFNQSWPAILRRAVVDGARPGWQEHGRHPLAGRTPGKFPLALTIGLMTIGVIVAISTLQLLVTLIG